MLAPLAPLGHEPRRMSRAAAPIAVFGAVLLCGCPLASGSRRPAPERAPASERVSQHPAATPAEAASGSANPEGNAGDEPDLTHDDATDPDADTEPSRSPWDVPVASRHAALDRAACEAELGRRHISYDRVAEARGVVAPLRLTGPLSGVTFRSNLPASKSRSSPYDIYDCRLVLSLDDFARDVLVKHDIVEVIHLSVYRPVSTKVALKGPGRRHGGALAIDAAFFKTKDGRTLTVEKDFSPRRIGARPCPAPKDASELRRIACEANDARIFNVLLTPDFNRAHHNHFHLEVTAGVRWTFVR